MTELITFGGINIPVPSSYRVSIEPLQNAERNARGDILIDWIAQKRKLELQWPVLTQAETELICSQIIGRYFTATYIDMATGRRTGTFYSGTPKAGVMRFKNGEVLWQDFGFNIVER